MVTFVDTEPSIIPLALDIDHSLFSAQNQSVNITTALGIGLLPAGVHILGAKVIKLTPFDVNSVQIGHGSLAAQRATIATAEEVSATTAGVGVGTAWADPDGFAAQLLTGNRSVVARLGAGSVPTVGLLRLVLLTYHPSPRSVL